MTNTDTLGRSYRTSRRLRATPIVLPVSTKCAWNLFYGMARISKFEAARVIANRPYTERMAFWYALSINEQADWLAIRENLAHKYPADAAKAFRATHGY